MSMDGMAGQRKGWTFWELVLAVCCGFLGAAVAVLAFIVIFATVTTLLAPYFHGLQWILPLLTEGAFTGAYLGWLLLDLRDVPPRWLQAVLSGYLSVFALASLVLNVWAGRASVPGAVAHGVVVIAFFGYLLLAKFIVHRLRATPQQRRLEQELGAARRYAIDVARDRCGRMWRWKVPSLLRRDILSGRLSDEVRRSVELAVSIGRTSGWRSTVLEWVTGELKLTARATAADRKALEEIIRNAPAGRAENTPWEPSGDAAEKPPQDTLERRRDGSPGRSQDAPGSLPRLTAAKAKTMTPEQLAPYVAPLLDEHGDVRVSRVMDRCHVGQPKAKLAIEAARRELRRRTVVPIEAGGGR